MERMKVAIVVAVVVVGFGVRQASAQVDLLDVWNWVPTETGAQPWQENTNWIEAGFPNNPGYSDPDETVISNSTAANASVPLGSNLNLNIQSPNVTVAALRMGGTAGAVTTDVTGPGSLVFENYEQNNNTDPDNTIYAFNRGNALIVSGGAVGATNTISAPVLINRENLEVGSDGTNNSTNSLTISGPITIAGGEGDSTTRPTLTSFLPDGLELNIAGTLTIAENNPVAEGEPSISDFGLNTSGNGAQGAQGTIIVSGTLTGPGQFSIGGGEGSGTTILSNANTTTGGVTLGGQNVVLGNDMSLGTGRLRINGTTFMSTDDARVIANDIAMPNVIRVAGDHSIEFSGELEMTNSRSWSNQLPAGKQFVYSGTQYIEDEQLRDHYDLHEYAFNGSGKTVVTGVIANNPENADWRGTLEKRGSGPLHMQGSQTQTLDDMGNPIPGTFNTVEYTGYTSVQGGTLHLSSIGDINTNGNGLLNSPIVSVAGGVGLENGTLTGPDSSTFLSLFNNRENAYTWLVARLRRFPVDRS